ncbi:hypothetical protein A6R68_19760 [Neotoma lepida]|uniref:Uncharacterized protein n=1 Tax=Neotoma lepida TaxID=56216 RepID=A0A1A6HJN3_NEOLE|nr:hypothetical protein A6R68_19760 [Neotoma lepida]
MAKKYHLWCPDLNYLIFSPGHKEIHHTWMNWKIQLPYQEMKETWGD